MFDPGIFDTPLGPPGTGSSTGFPHRYDIDGVDLGLWAYVVTAPTGVDEIPAVRGSNPPFTGLPGNQYLPKLRDSRHFALALYVLGTDAAGVVSTDSRAHARANLDALYTILGASNQRMVGRTMPDGSRRTCLAEVLRVSNPADPLGDGSIFALVAEFDMADPHWYGPSVIPGTLAVNAAEKSLAITHPGSAATHKLVFDFTGPMTGPRVTNDTAGAWFEWPNGVLLAGRHLIVDSGAFSATYDGADVAGQILHGGAIPFMRALPGVNALVVSTVVAGGTLAASLTPAYY